ncbi:putative hydrolase or acyltransferase of alpha/beta superfamily [Spongiibacter sp. IMCC21906]|nr:putative hydrolase or acyltransferase of alpha/beta superfamily [Spongiibacter sp. IMCC21906]
MTAMDKKTIQHRVQAEGVALNVFEWPGYSPDSPVMLLVHGYRANAHWWDEVVTAFAGHYRIVVPEFSGMGLSGWRERYDHWQGARDLAAVFDVLDIVVDIAVAHSWGGYQMLGFCCDNPERVRQLILVDSFFMVGPDQDIPAGAPIGNTRVYADKHEAVQRFRTSPRQPIPEPRRVALAEASLREVEGGWSWSYDPQLPMLDPSDDDENLLRALETPCDFILAGSGGVVSYDRAKTTADLAACRSLIVFEDAHHHLMLECPERLVKCISDLVDE